MGRGRRELEKEPKKILYGEVEKKKKLVQMIKKEY